MTELVFTKEPSFAELWDACLYVLYYPKEAFISELKNLFNTTGISIESKIIDVAAGTGFPALELMMEGYRIDCMDMSQDEIDVFRRKAKRMGIESDCIKLRWPDIPTTYKKNSYDLAFCRGN